MTILDRVARLFGREEDPAERNEMRSQLQQVQDGRARAETAIDELQRQAEQATRAYKNLTNPLNEARRNMAVSIDRRSARE